MKAKFDTEEITLTSRYVEALKELMRAEMEMMQINEPDMAECWTWGICSVTDLARSSSGLSFEFGGEDDKPEGFPGFTDCWVREGKSQLQSNGSNGE